MSETFFLHFYDSGSASRLAEWADDMDYESTIICPISEGHQRAGKRSSNLSILLPEPPIEDFVWTWSSECLVQEHVLEIFEANNFTGFEAKPAKARFKHLIENPPRLWELIITGWAGMAPPESGIKLVKSCPACGDLEYSGCTNIKKLIDTTQWDGSDFFIVWPLPKFVFVTERVAKIIRENHLSGAVFKSPAELDISDGFGPGRLSYWMPEKRAKELGEPLGIA